MPTTNITEKLIKNYSDRTYRYTAMISHNGTVVSFAMDNQRRIFYAVLDLNDTQGNKGEFDVAYWPDDPSQLQFPNEIEQVGYSIVGATPMPVVKVGTRLEIADPSSLQPDEIDRFLSSTARLSADAPFQVFSDEQHIFVFRQAIANGHADAVYKLTNGKTSGDTTRTDLLKSNNNNVPVVDSTLLCDRFVLAGKVLQPNREIRYQRSRHKTLPASQTDGLGANDMEGNPFFEPTQELAFIRNLANGGFTVLHLPTQVNGIKHWQLFANNSVTQRIDAFNLEVASDGLFNLQGTQLYTSPDPRYRDAVLEREPGTDPFTGAKLIPISQPTEHAETALNFDGSSNYVDVNLNPAWTPTAFTIEMWVKAAQQNLATGTGILGSSNSATTANSFEIVSDGAGNWQFKYGTVSLTIGAVSLNWQHLVITYDGTTLQSFVDATPVLSQAQTLSCQFSCFRLGANRQGDKKFTGTIDEVRVWDIARSGYDINSDRLRRLIGNELGLVGYWRFDEGAGTKAFDQTDRGNFGTINGTPRWVASDAPIGDHPGMRRSSFSFTGRTVVDSLSAKLYYQQEEVATGYDGNSKPMKKNARVMVTAATNQTSGGDPAIAVVDFAVSAEGRLARTPDVINLPVLEQPQASSDTAEISTLEVEIRTLTDEITQISREINALQNDVARIPTVTEDKKKLESDLDQLNRDKTFAESNYMNYWCKLQLRSTGSYMKTSSADAGVFHSTEDNDNVKWKFETWTSGRVRLISKSRTASGTSEYLQSGRPGEFCFAWSYLEDQDWSGFFIEQPSGSDYIRLRTYTSGWYVFKQYSGDRLVNHDDSSHINGQFTIVKTSETCNNVVADLQSKCNDKQTELTNKTTELNDLSAKQNTVSQKEALKQQKQTTLIGKQNQLSVLTGGEKQEIRLPMGFIHLDASGLTVNGSLMKFASSTKTPSLLDTATGELALYYPADVSKQFTAAYFQTLVARTRLQLSGGGVTLLSRAAGSNNITATISNGLINNTCNLVITNSNRSITETWTELPREPQLFADILNGQKDRPQKVTATVSPSSYSVKERSLQVVALSEGKAKYQEQTVRQTALNFDGQNDYIDLPPEMTNLIHQKITIEFWAKGGAGLPNENSIIYANDAARKRTLNIHLPWTNNMVVWDVGDGSDDFDRLELSVQNADYKGVWVHWAFVKNATDGTMAIYRNGNLAASVTGKTRMIGDSTAITVGRLPNENTNKYWNGVIDEFRIWSSARSQAEIQANMNQRLSGKETGLVACYSFENGQARDRSTNAYHGRLYGDPTSTDKPDALPALTVTTIVNGVANGVATVTPGRDSLWIANTPGRCYYFTSDSDLLSLPTAKLAQTAMKSDLTVEAWVNPGSTNTETARLIHHCSENAAYTLALQKNVEQSALSFNGTNDYISTSASLNNLSAFTLEGWVYVTSTNAKVSFFGQNDTIEFGIDNSKLSGWINNTSVQADSSFPLNQWQHVAFVGSSQQQILLYLNGQEVKRVSVSVSVFSNYGLATCNFTIGAGVWSGGTQEPFAGKMDEIRVWRRARSQAEIKAGMNCRLQGNETGLLACYTFINRVAKDRGPNGYNGTISGNPTVAAPPDQIASYTLIAGVSQGKTGNHQGQRFLKSKETLTANQWHHIAMRFRQSYGLNFNGQSYLDCGNNEMLDIGEDLTIEAFIQLERLGNTHGIIGKGYLDQADKNVPYQLKVASDGKLEFTFEDADGNDKTCSSTQALAAGTFYRVAVTRKKGTTQHEEQEDKTIEYSDNPNDKNAPRKTVSIKAIKSVTVEDWFDITFYIDGRKSGVSRYTGKAPIGNDQPLEIGRCQSSPRLRHNFQGIISEVRLWKKACDEKDIGKKIQGGESGLISWWQFEENQGHVATDSKSSNHGKIKGATWVKNPDPQGSPFNLLLNGLPLATDVLTSGTPNWGDTQFSMAGYKLNAVSSERFHGLLEEVRIWRTLRTDEQIGDNLFTRLKGEKQDLLAYYTFDDDSSTTSATQLKDNGLRGNHLSLPSGTSKPSIFLSSAPISDDTAAVRSALASVSTSFHEQIDSTPTVVEYSDLQRDNQGNVGGVLKRCYSYLQNGQWCLVTGYKVGNLVTEWIGQAQFAPQVIGYIEGAPPVPSENLADGVVDILSISDVSKIEFVESETVTYTLSASKEKSTDLGFKGAGGTSGGSDDLMITAPLGIGTAKKLDEVAIQAGVEGNFNTSNTWSQEENLGTSINRTRSMSVSLGGSWEGAGSGQQLNPAIGRRVQPANMGFALVQSQTADTFALRLAHNNALVSFRMVPNPDIPIDWNIIPFPINPQYTKQGTLDGRIGYKEDGSVCLDPNYANARQYGEYSYYKPKEAYAIERRIQREEQRLIDYYQSSDTEIANTGQIIGAAAGAAAGLLAGPLGVAAGAGVGAIIGGFSEALSKGTSLELPQKFAKRNLVNTYVWTADGGFFAETTQTTDVKTEVTAGSFSFSGAVGGSFGTDVEIFSIGFSLEFEASTGGGFSLTKTKAKDAEKSFSLAVNLAVPGNLQKTKPDANNEWKPFFDTQGNPVIAPGKVDAYRFKTFYLDSSERNFEDLFGKVVDPIWLAQSKHPNAAALRQANQSDKKPPCWRVFHRVTFISRILPEFPDNTAPTLDSALKAENIDSNWELIQKLDPFVRNQTNDASTFSDAVRQAVSTYLPELIPHSPEIITYLAVYYGIQGISESDTSK